MLDVKAGGQDHGADLDLDDLVFLVEADGLGGTDLFAKAAFALQVIGAMPAVDDRFVGNGLGKGDINGRTHPQAGVELAGDLFDRTFLGTQSAAGAELFIQAARFFADARLEIADETIETLKFGVANKG